MTQSAVTLYPLNDQEQAELATRLGRWRRQPLGSDELIALLPRVSDPSLALNVAERLAMTGPDAIEQILPLCERMGPGLPLIRALSICHHPKARDQLLAWLPGAGLLQPAVLEALACWGKQIDLQIIERALEAPGSAHRLAALSLLTFRCRSLTTSNLLKLTQPLLEDLRAEVVIATLRLLQRRDEGAVLDAIVSCVKVDALPGVAETALQALGCIGNEASCLRLIDQLPRLEGTVLEPALRRQLLAQGSQSQRIESA